MDTEKRNKLKVPSYIQKQTHQNYIRLLIRNLHQGKPIIAYTLSTTKLEIRAK
jgi:hypothetical protein